ncbi:hypothetical protein BD324DRAFT_650395 [Kockovaella imperatae]|uniref:Neurochondrin-domain-containing protein n=1 Tax=Kockovaella imperatae TaxID=4999 RepID=A0A1Y1UIN1_9TREE|nr:hypothetical protein BD324DRAFT_650395 [Kockovaella imperatae]ORX37852.1 hypothetical protein BD324DRAFT_650395 [Kockovaella imperatae]
MDDLSDVSRALEESLRAEPTEGSSFQQLFESFIVGHDERKRAAAVAALCHLLESVSPEEKDLILDHAGMTFIPILLTHYSSAASKDISRLVQLIASGSPAKEVVLSIVETLDELENQAQGVGDDDEDFLEAGQIQMESNAVVEALCLSLESLTKVIPRLRTERSTPTLLSLSDPLIDAFTVIATLTDSISAVELLSRLNEVIASTWEWVHKTSDQGGEQRAILTNVLFMGVTLLSSRLDARLAERMFINLFPKYKSPHAKEGQGEPAQRTLEQSLRIATELEITTSDLVHRLTHPSSISPYSSLASLALLVASLPSIAIGRESGQSHPISPVLLEDCMPVLSAALSSDALDAGIAWTWYLVAAGDSKVTHDVVTMLLELLVPPAATLPAPMTRTAIIKLMSALISEVENPRDQVLLYRQLVEADNPFDAIRVQGLAMIREAISKPASPILPDLHIIIPDLFTLPSTSISPTVASYTHGRHRHSSTADVTPLQLPLESFISSMWISWFIECVNLLWLILTIDKEDKAGLKNRHKLEEVYTTWVQPQKVRTLSMRSEWTKSVDGAMVDSEEEDGDRGDDGHSNSRAEVDFVLLRWEDALGRLDEEVTRILGKNHSIHTAGTLESVEE